VILKKILLGFGCAILCIGGIGLFEWYQATQLPAWYTTSTTAKPLPLNDKIGIQQARKQILHKSQLQDPSKSEAQLNADEVNTLIAASIVTKAHPQLAQAVKATNTQIHDGKISTGAVIDLQKVSQEQGTARQLAIAKLIKSVPDLKNRSVYIGIEGKPIVRNHQITLDDTSHVKVGNLSLTLSELSQRLGIPQERLQQQISQRLINLPLEVDAGEIVGDRLIIRKAHQ